MFGVVAIAGVGLMGGYLLANGAEEVPVEVDPVAASAEAEPSIDVVQVKVVKKFTASPTAAAATVDASNEDVAMATPSPPDFEIAFRQDDAAPKNDASVAPIVAAANQSAPMAADEPVSATDIATTESAPSPDPVAVASLPESAVDAPAAPTAVAPADTEPIVPPDAAAMAAPPPDPEPAAAVEAPADKAAGASPSFRCNRAQTETERAICDDADLAAKDREMARIYRQVRQSAAGSKRASVTDLQRAWLEKRDSCGGSKTCVLSAYNARIRELKFQVQ